MTRSHVLLHCRNPRIEAARERARAVGTRWTPRSIQVLFFTTCTRSSDDLGSRPRAETYSGLCNFFCEKDKSVTVEEEQANPTTHDFNCLNGLLVHEDICA